MSYRGECPYTIKEEFKNEYKEVCYKAQRLGIVVKQFGPYNFQHPLGIDDIHILDEMCKIHEFRSRNGFDEYGDPTDYFSELRRNADKCSYSQQSWDSIFHKLSYTKCLDDIKKDNLNHNYGVDRYVGMK